MKQPPAQPKVSGREARRRLTTLQEQTEQAVIPGIGLLVQAQAEQEERIEAVERYVDADWARVVDDKFCAFTNRTFWQRLKWLAGGR